jgi:hypothetical protein
MISAPAKPIAPRRIAPIGLGQVGQRFGADFRTTGRIKVATFDILVNISPEDVVEESRTDLGSGKLFVDINSLPPETKHADFDPVGHSGASYGVEETIIASLEETFPATGREKLPRERIGRVVQERRRRATETRKADETVAEPALKGLSDEPWRDVLDILLARIEAKVT